MANSNQPTVLLVHGAFADASGWAGVITELAGSGLDVIAPPNPLRGSYDKVYISSIAEQVDGPVLLAARPRTRVGAGVVEPEARVHPEERHVGRHVHGPQSDESMVAGR